MNAPSLRLRLTLWYTLGLVVALSLFGAVVILAQGRLGLRRIDRELGAFTSTLASVIEEELHESDALPTASQEATQTLASPVNPIAVFDAKGTQLAARWSGPDLNRVIAPAATQMPGAPGADTGESFTDARRVWTAESPTGTWRVHMESRAFAATTVVPATTLVLVTAHSLADVRREQHEVFEAMEVAIPLMLLLAGGGGYWLASVGLRPVTDMAARASRTSLSGTDNLGHTDRTDELGELARAFNGLVARLRNALRTQQQFMADASHELRTPVSVVRAASEVALSREGRDETDYRETLSIVGEQSRRLSRLVEHMLVLARADAGGYTLRPVDLYVNDVLDECCRALRALSDQRQVRVVTRSWPEVPFRGDEDLLKQLVLNVLQNAIEHTPAGTVVTLDLRHHNGRIAIVVADTGPGIPTSDRDRIFDRFVQLDQARRGTGSGLGLPIARWIAEAHGGSLVLEPSRQGSTFKITLPG